MSDSDTVSISAMSLTDIEVSSEDDEARDADFMPETGPRNPPRAFIDDGSEFDLSVGSGDDRDLGGVDLQQFDSTRSATPAATPRRLATIQGVRLGAAQSISSRLQGLLETPGRMTLTAEREMRRNQQLGLRRPLPKPPVDIRRLRTTSMYARKRFVESEGSSFIDSASEPEAYSTSESENDENLVNLKARDIDITRARPVRGAARRARKLVGSTPVDIDGSGTEAEVESSGVESAVEETQAPTGTDLEVSDVEGEGGGARMAVGKVRALLREGRLSRDMAALITASARLTMALQDSARAADGGALSELARSTLPHTLYSYQMAGVMWLRLLGGRGVGGILADEMGLGKTVQVLAHLALLDAEDALPGPALIVAPNSTLTNWAREADTWTSLNHATLYGTADDRAIVTRWWSAMTNTTSRHSVTKYRRLAEESGLVRDAGRRPDVLITSYSQLMNPQTRRDIGGVKWGHLIVDEAQAVKNGASQRHAALRAVKATHRLLLTGTPMQNSVQELLTLLLFINPGMPSPSKAPTTTDGLLDLLRVILAPVMLRRRKAEVVKELPLKTVQTVRVPMTVTQAAAYDAVRAACRARLKDAGYQGTGPLSTAVRSVVTNGVMELRKAASHPGLVQSMAGSGDREVLARAMVRDGELAGQVGRALGAGRLGRSDLDLDDIPLLDELLDLTDPDPVGRPPYDWVMAPHYAAAGVDLNWDRAGGAKIERTVALCRRHAAAGEKCIVFSQFRLVLDLLEVRLGDAGLPYHRLDGLTPTEERQTLIDDFSTGTADVMLLSTRAGGVGINLTAANVAIFHDHDYNPTSDEQAEARVHRIGQTRPVTVYRLVAENTVDEAMLAIAARKAAVNEAMLGDKKRDAGGPATEEMARLFFV